jgi:hypothetical protein
MTEVSKRHAFGLVIKSIVDPVAATENKSREHFPNTRMSLTCPNWFDCLGKTVMQKYEVVSWGVVEVILVECIIVDSAQ